MSIILKAENISKQYRLGLFVNAAGWLISKKSLETVGGFDPIFFHYGEDENYCQRLHYHGFKIGVCPEAKLRHDRVTRKAKKLNRDLTIIFII